jgi:transposase
MSLRPCTRETVAKVCFFPREFDGNALEVEYPVRSEVVMVEPIGPDYSQIMLFPPSPEEWVGPDHPARFIRDLVDSFDMESLGFRIPECKTGRPPYSADLLLTVWLYGYFNRIFSSRKLEKACREHMGLIWLTGMNPPDHTTLSRFIKANKEGVKGIFKQSVQVAVKTDLIGLALHAVDGTKIQSMASRQGVLSKRKLQDALEDIVEKLDRSLADVMTEIERRDREESGEYRLPASMQNSLKRKQRIQEALREVESTAAKGVNPADPDARFMKSRGGIELCYNGQAIADEQSGMIVCADVVTDGTDNGQLVPMLDQVKENVGAVAQENVADAGYFSSGQIGLAAQRKYGILVNEHPAETRSKKAAESDPYHHSRFEYDPDRDCCICPRSVELPFSRSLIKKANKQEVRRYQCRAYRSCPERWQCSRNKRGRFIEISVHWEAVERHRRKRELPESKELLRTRKRVIEPVFGWIKQQLGFRRWLVTGLESVRSQWHMVCATINLKKLYPYWVSGSLVL